MIPKIIHYCWFGREQKSDLMNNCLESWKKHLPDFRIIEWNEENFDVNKCQFSREAYEAKKWAFVSDYVRLYALYSMGGIYFDTDIEVLKPFDKLLDTDFLCGYESRDMIGTAVIGSCRENNIVAALLKEYTTKVFKKESGTYDAIPNPYLLTPYIKSAGINIDGKYRKEAGVTLYPQKEFFPNSLSMVFNSRPYSAYCIHHAEQSWVKESNKRNTNTFPRRMRRYAVGVLRNIIGTENTYNLRRKTIKDLKH